MISERFNTALNAELPIPFAVYRYQLIPFAALSVSIQTHSRKSLMRSVVKFPIRIATRQTTLERSLSVLSINHPSPGLCQPATRSSSISSSVRHRMMFERVWIQPFVLHPPHHHRHRRRRHAAPERDKAASSLAVECLPRSCVRATMSTMVLD